MCDLFIDRKILSRS